MHVILAELMADHFFFMCRREGRRERILAFPHGWCQDQMRQYL